jgi:uncharacterized phage infection (PIP) family protein YhgE
MNTLNTTGLAISNADQSNTLADQAKTIDDLAGSASYTAQGITSLLSGQLQTNQQLGQMSGQMDGLSQMMQSTLAGITDLQKSVTQLQAGQDAMGDLLGRFDLRLTKVEDRVDNLSLQPQLQAATPIPAGVNYEGIILRPGERINEFGQVVNENGEAVLR